MKKMAALVLFITLAGPAFAADGFVKSEADRSGATGTMAMIGNSIGGFFSHLGSALRPTKIHSTDTKAK